jgi:aarF domain-containing kinase
VTEFEALLDATEPVPWPVIRATIERELGAPLSRHFASIDEVPLASASIAQVHAATLASSGARVVIKVQKPGVADVLRADLAFLFIAARAAEFLNPALARGSVAAIAADIRAAMLDELDFTKEAAHVADFEAYLEATGMNASATCPFIYRQLSTRRVLTMERLDGVPLTDMAAVAAYTGADPAAVLANGLNAWLGSLIAARTFHADVHSGNLLALADGRVGFIDFGIAATVSPSTWAAVNALVAATAQRDYETMARALATMGAADADGVDFDAFGRDLKDVFEAAAAVEPAVTVVVDDTGTPTPAAVSFDEASVNRLLLTVVRVGDSYGVRFPREFGVLLKQLLYFDRYVTALAPGLAVGADPRVRLADLEARLGGSASGRQ